MIQSIDKNQRISKLFTDTKLALKDVRGKKIVIKINLCRLPEINHPRTDTFLLKKVIEYFLENRACLSICESADGYFESNLKLIGLLDFLLKYNVHIIDLDNSETTEVTVHNQSIYVPKIFKEFDYRISIPCASKRKGMLFSNNIKNFVGATPRKYYLDPCCNERWRAKLHDSLNESVYNVFNAFEIESKFHFYINGGNAYSEIKGAFELKKYYISDSAVDLDKSIYDTYFCDVEEPEYLKILVQEKLR